MFQLLDRARRFLLEKMGNIIKKPEAKVVDVDIKDLSRDGATYIAKVSVSNPCITPIPIGEISYTLKSADRAVASGKMEDPGSLPGNEKTVLEVPVKVAHSILVSLVKDIGAD
ncbi:desiccation protectant protein Lea14 homolog [Vitis riparia]|uniref:desiccation protectant protein Lea14 homolog n=1 Tax=Vitis riparia TaxID=96939 RepID=UPI00155A665A|nr:desiccation protectant protein Lea14 homolog [Vitis riparia]